MINYDNHSGMASTGTADSGNNMASFASTDMDNQEASMSEMIYRHKKTNKEIAGKILLTDDFGNLWYECQYTKVPVDSQDCIFIGAVMPNVSCTYVCAKDALLAFKESKASFNEFDANCNTCKNLERIPHKKQHPAALMRGICLAHPYRIKTVFHPDDYMGMKCWEAR